MTLSIGFIVEGSDHTDLSVMTMDDSNDINDNTTVSIHNGG